MKKVPRKVFAKVILGLSGILFNYQFQGRTKLLKCMTSEKCLNPCPPPKRHMEPEKGKSSLKTPFLGSMVFVGVLHCLAS